MNYEKQKINKKYYQDLSKFDLLTKQEIKDLYILIKQNNKEAIDKLITSNLKLVVHFAKNYRSILQKTDAIELDDLISEGNIGLIKAIKAFNPDLDIKFSYYAGFWIKKSINEFIINEGYVIRSPAGKIHSDNKIAKVVNELFLQNEYDVFENDVEELNQFTKSEISHYFYSKPNCVPIENENTINVNDAVCDSNEDAIELKRKISLLLDKLNEQEQTVIKMYYGLNNDYAPMTQKEVGESLGLTKARIGQVIDNALSKMKLFIKK